MKKDTKFLWIYIAILFSFALILIGFAGLTHNKYYKEIEQQQTESAGIKQSLITLTDENQKMSDTVKSQNSEIDSLKSSNDVLGVQNELMIKAIGGDEATTRLLLEAYAELYSEDTALANDKIKEADESELNDAQKIIYDECVQKLNDAQ